MKNLIQDFVVKILKEQTDRTLTGFQAFDEFNKLTKGDFDWTLPDRDGNDTNIIILSGVSSECIETLYSMLRNKIIKMKPTNLLVVHSEGVVYNELELAKSIRIYKKPRWLPMLIEKGENFDKY